MKTKEQLRTPRDLDVAVPMAARAVALCEGCPMAKFCAVRVVAPCETPQERNEQIDAGGGGYEAVAQQPEMPVRRSYRNELMDDSLPLVMAKLQKKKEPLPVFRPPAVKKAEAVTHAVAKPRPAVPPRKPTPPRPRRETAGEGTGDILADIMLSMLSVRAVATSRARKSV